MNYDVMREILTGNWETGRKHKGNAREKNDELGAKTSIGKSNAKAKNRQGKRNGCWVMGEGGGGLSSSAVWLFLSLEDTDGKPMHR